MKRIYAVAITLLLLLSFAGCAADGGAPSTVDPSFTQKTYIAVSEEYQPGLAPEGMELVTAKGYVALFYNPQTADFTLEDMRTGERYDSRCMSGTATLQERSQLIVSDLDIHNGTIRTKYSPNAKVTTGKTEDGFQVWYVFQEEQYAIPVEYFLLEDGLRVRVRSDRIKEEGDTFRVASLTVLPYFYAQQEYPEGFMLVPDGSGAQILLNEDKSAYGSYESPLYGDSYLTVKDYRFTVTEACRLPFVGLQAEKGGFLAVAEAGATAGRVFAAVEGQNTTASHVCFGFDLRKQQEAYIGNPESSTAKTVIVNEKGPIALSDVSVRYFLLDSSPDTGLGAMAAVARAVVADRADTPLSAPDNALYLTTLGGFTVEEPVLGFRAKVTRPVTEFKEAASMLQQLQQQDVDKVALIYTGYSRAVLRGKLTDTPKPDPRIGSLSDLIALSTQLGKGRLLLTVDTVTLRKTANGLSTSRSTVRDINLKTVELYRYKRNTAHADRSTPFYLLKPDLASALLEKATDWVKDTANATVLVDGFSDTWYGDYSAGGYNREQMKEQVYTTLKKLSDGAPLYTTAANYDAAVLSSVVVNAPGSSSGYDLFDQDVPFYQMVLSGERQLVSVPLNVTAGDVDAAFAQCVRFGMVPHFELIDSEEQMLGAYGLESFYAANYAVWGSRIVGYYAEYSTVYEAIKGRTLEDYRILSPGVYQLTYSGEVQLTVDETGDVARFTVQS